MDASKFTPYLLVGLMVLFAANLFRGLDFSSSKEVKEPQAVIVVNKLPVLNENMLGVKSTSQELRVTNLQPVGIWSIMTDDGGRIVDISLKTLTDDDLKYMKEVDEAATSNNRVSWMRQVIITDKAL